MAQMVENLLAVQETQVQSLGREDPLEKGMANHSRTLAWRWTEEADGNSPWGRKESDTTEQLNSTELNRLLVISRGFDFHAPDD